MKTKYDVKKVSRQTLEDLAEHFLRAKRDGINHIGFPLSKDSENEPIERLVEEAKVPLRTKAEVDADIAKTIRRYQEAAMKVHYPHWLLLSVQSFYVDGKLESFGYDLCKLLKEETSD